MRWAGTQPTVNCGERNSQWEDRRTDKGAVGTHSHPILTAFVQSADSLHVIGAKFSGRPFAGSSELQPAEQRPVKRHLLTS